RWDNRRPAGPAPTMPTWVRRVKLIALDDKSPRMSRKSLGGIDGRQTWRISTRRLYVDGPITLDFRGYHELSAKTPSGPRLGDHPPIGSPRDSCKSGTPALGGS